MLPSNAMPADESWIARRISDLEKQVQELSSAVAGTKAIQGQQDQIAAQQANLVAQVAFLLGQTVSASTAPGVVLNTGPSLPAWTSGSDVSIPITTSSSGKLLLTWSARVLVNASGSSAGHAGVYVEVLNAGNAVVAATDYTGLDISAASGNPSALAGVGSFSIVALTGNTPYTVRTRRVYYSGAAGSAAIDLSALSVTKIGM